MIMKKGSALLFFALAIFVLGSCKKDQSNLENKFWGAKVFVGQGEIRSLARIDHEGKPLELAVAISPNVVEHLFNEGNTGTHPSWTIPFHQSVLDATPFKHLTVNWNPAGHPPTSFADPHFDIHFYMITEAERLAIPVWSPTTDLQFNTKPPAGYMPTDYITPPGAVGAEAAMGKHWLPPSSNFTPFNHVMILGTYDGSFNFIEPMVTVEYLARELQVTKEFSQPQKFARAGYYPTKYNVWKDSWTAFHMISLSDFVWRDAN
jgi:hypothetical protein